MKFVSPEVALYLYKSTIRPCIDYCCHTRAGAPSCFLELLDKVQKLLVFHLLPLLNPWLIVEMQPAQVISIGITLVDIHLNWLNWFLFLILQGDLLLILIDYMIFLSQFLDVTRMSVNNFFPHTARLRNSLPLECFPLTCDLNGFKSRINRHLLTVGSF